MRANRPCLLLALALLPGCKIVGSTGDGSPAADLSDQGSPAADLSDPWTEDDIWICSREDLGCVRPPDLRPRSPDLDFGTGPEAGMCSTTCAPACPAGTECVATGTVAAACFQPCRTTDDCGSGFFCVGKVVSLGTNYVLDAQQPRHCLPPDAVGCGNTAACNDWVADGQHCDLTDATVLVLPFRSCFGSAFQYVRCPNGCGRGDLAIDVRCNP